MKTEKLQFFIGSPKVLEKPESITMKYISNRTLSLSTHPPVLLVLSPKLEQFETPRKTWKSLVLSRKHRFDRGPRKSLADSQIRKVPF